MKQIKTLNELLAKTLSFILFSVVCFTGNVQAKTPSLSASIDEIKYDVAVDNSITYQVWLNFDFDRGSMSDSQMASITALDFDLELAGFNEWYFITNDILVCGDNVIYNITRGEGNLAHIKVKFSEEGITDDLLSCGPIHGAAVGIIIDGSNRDYLTATYDCYDYHNKAIAHVSVSNAKFTLVGEDEPIIMDIDGNEFNQTYHLPSCLRDNLSTAGTYDINLMISNITDTGVEVGVYLRSYTDVAPPIDGEMHVSFKHTEFQSAILSSDSPVQGALSEITFAGNYSNTVFSFSSANDLGSNNQQIHVATLIYPYNAVDINCMFMAHPNATKVWDANGVELELVGDQEREYVSGSPSNARLTARSNPRIMQISPNPANDKVYIDIPNSDTDALITIIDIQGKDVLSKNVTTGSRDNVAFDVSHLKKGLYLIKATAENHHYQDRLIIN